MRDTHLRVSTRYVDAQTFTAAAFPIRRLYRPWMLYDIDLTGVGHQPFGFDSLSTMFNRYITVKVSWELTIKNTNAHPLTVVANLNGSESTNTQSLQFLLEQPKNVTATVDNAGGRNVRTIRG